MLQQCPLCTSKNLKVRFPTVRDTADIHVKECNACTLVFLSSFDHMSDSFYEESNMRENSIDLNEYRKKTYVNDSRRVKTLEGRIQGKTLLDVGCGTGGFINLVNRFSKKVDGLEIDRKLSTMLNEEGIRCYSHMDEIDEKYDFITLFHVLEHIPDPSTFLEKLKKLLKSDGKIIIEVPNAEDALLTLYNSEDFAAFTYWSCHLYVFNAWTLKQFVEQAGYKMNDIKQIQRYSLANHLFWLSNGKPGGHVRWEYLDNKLMNELYGKQLASIGKCDTLFAEISIK